MANAGVAIEQLHIRLPADLAADVRRYAREFEVEISTYIADVLRDEIAMYTDGKPENDQRQTSDAANG